MNRASLARRYAPLAALAAVQLLIIAVVPSKAPTQQAAATGPLGSGGFNAAAGPEAATGPETQATGAGATGGRPGARTGTGAGAAGKGPAATGATTPAGVPTSGDTSHCVAGRQFDPAIDYYAPPCVPKWTGGQNNGGATYQGVTASTIRIVQYFDHLNDAINTLLKASGNYVSADQYRQFNAAAEKFINDHYELYGRKIKIDVYEGKCTTAPPDLNCLRPEMDDLVKTYQPYFVYWPTTLCSACFDELSANKTPNAGGYYFRAEFSQAHRPYHWDVTMNGTRLAQQVAELYCKEMAPYPARWAGDDTQPDPRQKLNGKPRVLGVISTNDPENQTMVQTDLKAALAKCGASYQHEYYYAQDISTAEQQRKAGVNTMRDNPQSTTVLCLCDEVAPQFLYEEERQQLYYPENLLGGTGFMDRDTAGQSYDHTLCQPASCQEFENAFGLSQLDTPEAIGADRGARVWKLGGGQGPVPFDTVSEQSWDYLNMIASMIQAAGPNLNPFTMEQGAFAMGFRGGGTTGHRLRGFAPGNYTWNQDMRVVYWSTQKTSPYNGKPGTYVQVYPQRFNLGEYLPQELQLPGKPR